MEVLLYDLFDTFIMISILFASLYSYDTSGAEARWQKQTSLFNATCIVILLNGGNTGNTGMDKDDYFS